jgi:phytoene dehydrogenase-like protein
VLVLERAAKVGGDTSTEEVTLPGFHHDLCASAHTLFQSSPIVRNDELKLGRYGLRYLFPDPVVVMPFPGGRSLTMFHDRAATLREIARFSLADARAYERLLGDWDAIKECQNRARYSPATTASAAIAALEATAPGVEAVRWRYSSALEVVRERFADEQVRTFFLWLSLMTMAWVDQPGTGLLPLSISAGRQVFSWTTAERGSIALPEALARIVRDHGVEIRVNSTVHSGPDRRRQGGRGRGGGRERAPRAPGGRFHHPREALARDRGDRCARGSVLPRPRALARGDNHVCDALRARCPAAVPPRAGTDAHGRCSHLQLDRGAADRARGVPTR